VRGALTTRREHQWQTKIRAIEAAQAVVRVEVNQAVASPEKTNKAAAKKAVAAARRVAAVLVAVIDNAPAN
jgi:hypothetical protein